MNPRYDIIVHAARDSIICANSHGKITFVNRAAEELFGYSSSKLLGHDLAILMPERYRSAHHTGLKRFMKTGKPKLIGKTIELSGLNSQGVEFPLELSLSINPEQESNWVKPGEANRIVSADEKNIGAIGIIRDITERRKLLDKLEERATTDYLTGLCNRHLFDKKLSTEWTRSRRYKSIMSLLMTDLDHFKEYNDLYGHQAGDVALKEIADILLRTVRSTDIVARYGGEEIVVILPETEISEAIALAQRIVDAVAEKNIVHAGNPESKTLTVSIGVASADSNEKDATRLIKNADDALYAAKNAGRNRLWAHT